MADKRISQLTDRGTVANNDVVPIVVSGAVTTNKATISSIQTFMQGNLDLGVTSVGITLGSTGTDVSVTGSPITTSGNITINIPTASAANRGVLSAADYITFNSKQGAITLTTTGTSGAATLVSNTLNIPNYAQDLSGFVTLGTAQTITAQKTFTTSGSSDTMIISHGSGSGFALDVLKAGNGEAIRVTKSSGSGNAMTISGGNFEAGTIVKTGGTSSQFLMADGSVNTSVLASGAYLPLAGGTLTGTLNGTSANFTNNVTIDRSLSTLGNALTLTKGSDADQAWLAFQQGAAADGVWRLGYTGDPYDFRINVGSNASIGTQALRIFETTQNVVIGTSTSDNLSRLQVGGSATFSSSVNITASAGGGAIELRGRTADNLSQILFFNNNYTNLQNYITSTTSILSFNSQGNTPIEFGTNVSGGGGARLTISGTGAATFSSVVGINRTPSSGFKLDIQGNEGIRILDNDVLRSIIITPPNSGASGTISTASGQGISFQATNASGNLVFETAGTERMRITSGGFLKATNTGTYISSSAAYHELNSNVVDDWAAIIRNSSASPYGLQISYGASPNSTANQFIWCPDGTALRFEVRSNGDVRNFNNSYGSLSDIKLKENIEDATPKLDDLLKVKIRNYNLIGDDKKQIGVIAQELEDVFPNMVDEVEDYEEVEVPQLDEEGNEILNEEGEVQTTKERISKGTSTKSVKYSVFVPMLIKAIQELKTEIDSLKNQIK